MKTIIAIVICLALVGCATVLTVEERDIKGNLIRTIRAEDYSIKTPTLSAVPSRWLTPNFVSEIFKGIVSWQSIIPAVVPTPSPINPTPAPAPVQPTPNPGPYPAPTPNPSPVVPTPAPLPVDSSVFTKSSGLITLDLNTLPGSMRGAGFQGSDNALYYAMGHVYAYGPGKQMVPHAELDPMNTESIRTAMFNWFDGEVLKVISLMKSSPGLNLVAISNDGKDRCGFRLGPAILSRTGDAGLAGRSTLGQILPPENY